MTSATGVISDALIDNELRSRLVHRVHTEAGLDRDTARRIVGQTLGFLMACALNPEARLVPSELVDHGWHAFILHTREYASFCEKIAGHFIHHVPVLPGEGDQRAALAVDAMRAAGIEVDADLWGRTANCSGKVPPVPRGVLRLAERNLMDAWAWELMPSGVRAAVEERAGTIVKAEPLVKGPAPGVAAVLHHAGGERHVLKAAPEDSPAAHLYLNELNVSASMPLSLPAARMRYGTVAGGWAVMLFEYLPDARHADLSPGSDDLDGVIAALGAVGSTAAWEGLRPVSGNVARLRSAAGRLVSVLHDGAVKDLYAASLEKFDSESLEGDHLVHYDLHAPNILVSGGQVHMIDWAFGCAGAEGLDAVLLLPRLVAAGHEPTAALDAVAGIPGWRSLPVTAVVALWTMFRHYKAVRGPSEHRGRYVPSITAGQRLLRCLSG